MKTSEYLKQLRLAIALNDKPGLRHLIFGYRVGDEFCERIPSDVEFAAVQWPMPSIKH